MSELFEAPAGKSPPSSPTASEDVFLQSQPVARGPWPVVCTKVTITQRKRVARTRPLPPCRLRHRSGSLAKPYSDSDPYAASFFQLARENPRILRYDGPISDRKKLAEVYRAARRLRPYQHHGDACQPLRGGSRRLRMPPALGVIFRGLIMFLATMSPLLSRHRSPFQPSPPPLRLLLRPRAQSQSSRQSPCRGRMSRNNFSPFINPCSTPPGKFPRAVAQSLADDTVLPPALFASCCQILRRIRIIQNSADPPPACSPHPARIAKNPVLSHPQSNPAGRRLFPPAPAARSAAIASNTTIGHSCPPATATPASTHGLSRAFNCSRSVRQLRRIRTRAASPSIQETSCTYGSSFARGQEKTTCFNRAASAISSSRYRMNGFWFFR